MANATILYACTGDGLVILTRPGTLPEWLPPKRVLEGERVTSVWAEPGPPIRVVAVASGALMLSENGGRTWSDAQLHSVFTCLFSAGEPPLLIAAHEEGQLSASSDGGISWQALERLPERGDVLAFAAHGDDVYVLMEQLGESVLLGGNPLTGSWRTLVAGETATAIAVDNAAGVLFGAFADGVRGSSDGGARWGTLAGSPPAALALAIVPGAAGKPPALVAGTPLGLRVSQDGGDSWQEASLGEATGEAAGVTALVRDPERRDRLYAATSSGYLFESGNRGQAWERINPSPLPPANYLFVLRI